MFRRVRRPIRPLYRSAALAFLWANRRDVRRWLSFAQRVATKGNRPSAADVKLEARVRAALSRDPLLRNDPAIRDIRVNDGVVVLETPADWHNRTATLTRIGQVTGVTSVQTAADVDQPQWLDVSSAETPVEAATI